jgi:MoaA/NifB/PqqE/SkfB family radical SAM enzyme
LLGEIAIGGGEPFVRADVLQVVELARERGFRTHLISNGWLVDESLLRDAEQAGLDTLMISLNSLTASVHDESRGKTGSHERIMGLVEAWAAGEHKTKLCLSTIVIEANCGELAGLDQRDHVPGPASHRSALQLLCNAEHAAFRRSLA